MKHGQKAKVIICICMLLVGVFSAFSLFRGFRPSAGLPYEQLTLEKAEHYMEFEEGYKLVDVRTKEEFAISHMKDAVNIPYETVVEQALGKLPDKAQMIYVYGSDADQSGNACRKLCELGYTSITQITDWKE